MSHLIDESTSIVDHQKQLIEEFLLFENWAERYQYLIDLGDALAPLPVSMRTDANRITGCHSETFLIGVRTNGQLRFHGASDMPTLAGLLAIIIRVYSNKAPADILRHPPDLLDSIGLTKILSPHRRVALLRIHERLITLASDMPEVSKRAS